MFLRWVLTVLREILRWEAISGLVKSFMIIEAIRTSVGDSLLGRTRVFDRVLELDGSSTAAAWKLDCLTLERQSRERRPRR